MANREREDDADAGRNRSDRPASDRAQEAAGAEGRRAAGGIRPTQAEALARQRDELTHAADYQSRPETERSDEATRDRTVNARRAEETSGRSPDENNQRDAERAFRESRGGQA